MSGSVLGTGDLPSVYTVADSCQCQWLWRVDALISGDTAFRALKGRINSCDIVFP